MDQTLFDVNLILCDVCGPSRMVVSWRHLVGWIWHRAISWLPCRRVYRGDFRLENYGAWFYPEIWFLDFGGSILIQFGSVSAIFQVLLIPCPLCCWYHVFCAVVTISFVLSRCCSWRWLRHFNGDNVHSLLFYYYDVAVMSLSWGDDGASPLCYHPIFLLLIPFGSVFIDQGSIQLCLTRELSLVIDAAVKICSFSYCIHWSFL